MPRRSAEDDGTYVEERCEYAAFKAENDEIMMGLLVDGDDGENAAGQTMCATKDLGRRCSLICIKGLSIYILVVTSSFVCHIITCNCRCHLKRIIFQVNMLNCSIVFLKPPIHAGKSIR